MFDEEVRDGWAAATVRLKAVDVTVLPVPEELARLGRVSRSKGVMSFEFDNSNDARLSTLLNEVEGFLAEHLTTLIAVPGCTYDLFLGWSPLAPQESLQINVELIRLLARLKASIVFDTYSA